MHRRRHPGVRRSGLPGPAATQPLPLSPPQRRWRLRACSKRIAPLTGAASAQPCASSLPALVASREPDSHRQRNPHKGQWNARQTYKLGQLIRQNSKIYPFGPEHLQPYIETGRLFRMRAQVTRKFDDWNRPAAVQETINRINRSSAAGRTARSSFSATSPGLLPARPARPPSIHQGPPPLRHKGEPSLRAHLPRFGQWVSTALGLLFRGPQQLVSDPFAAAIPADSSQMLALRAIGGVASPAGKPAVHLQHLGRSTKIAHRGASHPRLEKPGCWPDTGACRAQASRRPFCRGPAASGADPRGRIYHPRTSHRFPWGSVSAVQCLPNRASS